VRTLAAGALFGALAASCSLALDFASLDDGTPDGGSSTDSGSDRTFAADGPLDGGNGDGATSDAPQADAPQADAPPTDGSKDTATTDGPGTFDAPPEPPPDGPCGPLPGATMVAIGSFCVDSTEVTVAEYTDYLTAKAGDTSGQPPECSGWNTSLVPGGWPPGGPDTQPVANLNWCQAFMYCAWAGKHLCGDIDGGPADPNRWGDSTASQWFKVCSHNNDGLHAYPYGNTYAPATCNGKDDGVGHALPSLATCVGGYAGVFDMSGNVLEWEDSCTAPGDAGPGPGEYCHTRGGDYGSDDAGMVCNAGVLYTRGSAAPNVGFRCCAR
jgi:sulfatase modifying factor 1